MNTFVTSDIDSYAEIETRFFTLLSEALGERLLLYCVTGSLARKEILGGWSDIDIFVVVDTYDRAVFEVLKDSLKNNQSQVKIGVTLMVPQELARTFPKPSRLYDVIDCIRTGTYIPRIYNVDAVLLEVQDEQQIRSSNRSEFGFFLQFFKKSLMAGPNDYNEQEAHKNLTILLKILLREKGIKAYSYDDVARDIDSLRILNYAFKTPSKILESPSERGTRYNDYLGLLEWINKNHHAVFQ
jgi:Nucleotidyltransferase domain